MVDLKEAPSVNGKAGLVLEPGTWLVGVLGGVESDSAAGRTSILVRFSDPGDREAWARKVRVTPFDPQTGRANEAYEAALGLAPGTAVALRVVPETVWLRDRRSFIVWHAVSLVVLP